MYEVMNKYPVAFVLIIIGFMGIDEIIAAAAQDYINQTDSTKLDNQKIIVTLEINETDAGQVICISIEDFRRIFGPHLGQSNNMTTSALG